jgi:multidrug resistance efflux pump
MSELNPIPVPTAQRWREFRIRLMPVLVFGTTLALATVIWKQQMPTTVLLGEVEPITANISSPKSGVLANLNLTRLQQVKAGDKIAQVITTDPRVLQSSLAVILAEIQLIRVNLEPMLGEQRYALSYDRLRLDWMEQRVELAAVRTRLQLAESEFNRVQGLYKDRVVSEAIFEEARITKDQLENEVQERSRFIEEQEKNLTALQLRAGNNLSATNLASAQNVMQASINVQEQKLRLTEAELSPVVLSATVDGVVSAILRRSGEAVVAGEPILTISTGTSDRIIAYVRQPLVIEPKVGMSVEVCARSLKRPIAAAQILQIGTQMEPIKPYLSPFSNGQAIEMGLPILVNVPASLKLLPGEIVDLRLKPEIVPTGF